MHRLHNHAVLELLNGKQLEMLCFAPYSLYFHFSEHIMLTIEGEFQHVFRENGKKKLQQYLFPITTSELPRLLSEQVQSVEMASSDGSLQLRFSNGDRLTIYGGSSPYESFRIKHNGAELIV
jgi:hypothetical protein